MALQTSKHLLVPAGWGFFAVGLFGVVGFFPPNDANKSHLVFFL